MRCHILTHIEFHALACPGADPEDLSGRCMCVCACFGVFVGSDRFVRSKMLLKFSLAVQTVVYS